MNEDNQEIEINLDDENENIDVNEENFIYVNIPEETIEEMQEDIEELKTDIQGKVDKVAGKGLSTEDYTTAEKNKLANLENYDDTEVKADIQENTDSIEALETKHDIEVAELQSDIEALENIIPTGDASGSDITLSDSARYYFKKIVPGGKSEQETFTGKNFLEVLTNVYKDRGLTTTKLSDGGFKVTGTAMSTYSFIIYDEPINLEPGTYTFSIKESLTTNLRLFPMLEDGTTEGSMTISAGSKSTTTTFTNKIIGIRILLFTTEGTNYDLTIYPMIEQGSTATEYEKYVGGQPAPNPDYECPIKNVTGDVEVKVENKNLAVLNTGDYGVYRVINPIPVKQGDVITLIVNWNSLQERGIQQAIFRDENMTEYIQRYNTITDKNQDVIQTINITNDGYLGINYSYPVSNLTINKLFVGKGTYTLNDYAPHEEQTAIFPLEEGQILHEGDTIEDKIVQRRKTVVFDGTENWLMSTNDDVYRYIISLPDRKERGDGLSNYFKTTNSSSNEGLYNGISINFITREITTVAAWKAWVAEKYANGTPLTLEYELAEPIEIPFTQAQRQAKAQIDKLYSYKGTTHITSNANLDVTYRKDPNIRDTRLDALEARVALLEG